MPKTIDNDYMGIDFTFGYFTAVETLAAKSATCWPTPNPRRATSWPRRWAAVPAGSPTGRPSPGEASLVISVEDITGKYRSEEEVVNPKTGEKTTRAR